MLLSKSKMANIALLLALAGSGGNAFAKSLTDEGLAHYNAGRYPLAIASLSAAVAREPAGQLLHYYLANAFVHTGDHRRALEEYRICYQLNPQNTIGEYSRKALVSYKAPLPSPSDPTFVRVYKKYMDAAKTQSNVVAIEPELEKARNIIRRQADIEKNKHRIQSAQSQKVSRHIAEEEAKRVDSRAEAEIQKLYEPIVYSPGPRANPLLANPDLLKQKEDAIKKAAAEEKEYILRHAEESSETYKSWESKKTVALDEVAANLESQLEQPAGRSGVKLQAKGTDLYVRNYVPFHSKANLNAHPAIVRIVSQDYGGNGEGDDKNSLSGDKAESLQDPRNVHGKVLKRNLCPSSL